MQPTEKQMPLSPTDLRTLRAAVDRIIPADDFPGAWEAGFPGFLERLLNQEPEFVSDYERLLPALNAESQAVHTNDFADLDPADQDAVLISIERGNVSAEWQSPPDHLLHMLIRHAS